MLLILTREMMRKVNMIENIAVSRAVPFELNGWDSYVNSNKWQADKELLLNYSYKYRIKYESLYAALRFQQQMHIP